VADVIDGSPAQRAGVAPGDKIVAIDDRAVGGDGSESLHAQLDAALVRAERGGPATHVLLLGGGVYRDVAIPYNGGPRYPVLERIPGTVDRLDAIGVPLVR
jgi:predicted metalloprotease with PDZ domain